MESRYNFKGDRYKRNSPFLSFLKMLFLALTIGGGAYFFFNSDLEYQEPIVNITDGGYWNQKKPIAISINDKGSGVKSYQVSFLNNGEETILLDVTLSVTQKQVDLSIDSSKFPKNAKNIKLIITANDGSKWNFYGNKSVKEVDLIIDGAPPIVDLVANSYSITRGGGATVVAGIKDDNLKEAYVSFNNDVAKFKLTQFYKDGYYMSIIAWPIKIEEFISANIIATDKAGNKTITKIPLYTKPLQFSTDKIEVTDEFVQNATMKVLQQANIRDINDTKKAFLYSNKELRAKNIETIFNLVSKTDISFKNDFNLLPFKRLDSSATLAKYADKRIYFKDKVQIDEQWHLGTDWASVQNAPVMSSNAGNVVFSEYLGIYGNTIIIDHGFGIMSLYAHLSSSDVKVSDKVTANQKIGATGSTGGVFGDHLHFGILIGGYESDTKEWLDEAWIKVRIKDIIDDAKRKIDSK